MVGVMDKGHYMNPQNTNIDGWKDCDMRQWLNETIFPTLPTKWQAMIVAVDILANVGGMNTTRVHTTSDKLFLLSMAEVGQMQTTAPYPLEVDPEAEQVTFAVFTDNYSRGKRLSNGTGALQGWWLRSAYHTSSSYFGYIQTSGASAGSNASNTYYYPAWGFCI